MGSGKKSSNATQISWYSEKTSLTCRSQLVISTFWAVVQNLVSQASKPTEKSGLKPMFIRGITLFFLMFFSCVFYHAYHAYHAPTIVVYGVNGHPLQIARELLFFCFHPYV